MKKKNLDDLIYYRINRANETLNEANALIKLEFWNAAINRLYYACFYAVNALMLKHNISAHTHSGVRQMLGLHFVKTGKISRKHAKFYTDLFDLRHTSDYDDFVFFDKTIVEDLYSSAKEFIQIIKIVLKKN